MTNIADLVGEWHERIRRDIAPFADPGTEVQTIVDGRTISAKWTMRNLPFEADFAISAESGVLVRRGGAELAYSSFFASADMADLLGLSKMILQSAPETVFIDTPASRPDSDDRVAPATTLITEALEEAKSLAATAILIVTGDAGSGKTSVLQELVKRTADDFTAGRSGHVLLYVNAQGRALARFDEALATELSDLRARLTYHAVPTLTRLGLLVPVIDGFDELLGVSGYDEAFSSLSRFVEDLDGEGQIIASARSTYYEQEFVSRSNKVSSLGAQVWHQIPIHVLEWGPAEIGSFFDRQIETEGMGDLRYEIRLAFDKAFEGEKAELASKPFFVSRVLRLVMEGQAFTEPGQLLSSLIRAYTEREVGKLRGRAGEPLLSSSQIVELLQEIAEEMWNQESRELAKRSIRDVAEFALTTHEVPEEIQRYVIERIPSFAFLTSGTSEGNVTFEHESFFAFFLGTRLSTRLESSSIQLHALLGRSAMPDQVAEAAARRIAHAHREDELRRLLLLISDAAAIQSTRHAQVRENGGLLSAALLRNWCASHGELVEGSLGNITVPGGSLAGVTLSRFELVACELRRVDLTRTRLLQCAFQRGLLHDVIVDPSFTRLEFEDFDPSMQLVGLRVVTDSGVVQEYGPVEVRETLASCGMEYLVTRVPIARLAVRADILELLDRIVRAYQRSNPISVNEDEARTTAIFRSPDWPRVEQLLLESGVATREFRSTRGSKRSFLRRQVNSEEILIGADPSANVSAPVRQLWKMLVEEFPERAE